MEHLEMHAAHSVVDLIDDEIEKAEEHLECALVLGHAHHDHAMHMKHAEESIKDAEEWMAHKHGHMQKLKDSEHAHHKSVCDFWHHRHPELQKDLDEVKWKHKQHKDRTSGYGR